LLSPFKKVSRKQCVLDSRLYLLKIYLYKSLHFYIPISSKKESSANYSGDGPPTKNSNMLLAEELQILQISALQRNDKNVYRLQINSRFKVVAIDVSVF